MIALQPTQETHVTVRLPEYHAQQRRFRRSKAKRKVICAGRRGGKTTGVAGLAVEEMLKGKRVLEAAPVSAQTDAFWNACIHFLAEPIKYGVIKKNETDRTLEVVEGTGRIKTKTAHNADTLRGDYADVLILDEYSFMDPDAWQKVGAPMLLDNDGDAIFIFTPNRKNHAFRLYARATSDTSGRWAAFHFTSLDNPHLSKAALAEITEDMTEDDYIQEILARFLESDGQVFRNIANCSHAPLIQTPEMHIGHRIVAGCDWGQKKDFTCFSFGCVDCGVEVARDRFNKIKFDVQRGRLVDLYELWQPEIILTEINSIGQPNFEELEKLNLPLEPFETTIKTKGPLIQKLVLALEKERWQFQSKNSEDPWTLELEAYESVVSPKTHNTSYSAPKGLHDDTVMARAMMVWQAAELTETEVTVRQATIRGRENAPQIIRTGVARVTR